jgi:hypothetical protein
MKSRGLRKEKIVLSGWQTVLPVYLGNGGLRLAGDLA